MRPEGKSAVAPLLPHLVQRVQIGVDVVCVVGVCGVELEVPLPRSHHVLRGPPLWLALIIHHVKSYHLPHSLTTSDGLQAGNVSFLVGCQ